MKGPEPGTEGCCGRVGQGMSGRSRKGPNPIASWCQLREAAGFKPNGEAVLSR